MEIVTPTVYLIGQTKMHYSTLGNYLKDIGADDYNPELVASDGENLIAAAGKFCYKSWQPELNPNVTRVRTDGKEYLENLVASGHGSVLEHASVSFLFQDVSRVFTHELVRHRVGTAYSQESLRYVRLTDLRFWLPQILRGNEEGVQLIVNTVKHLEYVQQKLAEIYNVTDPDMSFTEKKKLTSAFRRVAPIGLATGIIFTANLRTLRHLIPLRTARFAEEEIRLVFAAVAEICRAMYPNLFGDMCSRQVGGYSEYYFKYAAMPYDKSDLEYRMMRDKRDRLEKTVEELQQEIQDRLDEINDMQVAYEDLQAELDAAHSN
jgi:thymidylate synthase (FAD)